MKICMRAKEGGLTSLVSSVSYSIRSALFCFMIFHGQNWLEVGADCAWVKLSDFLPARPVWHSKCYRQLGKRWKKNCRWIFFLYHAWPTSTKFDWSTHRNYFLSVIKNFIRYTNNSTQFDIKAACLCSSFPQCCCRWSVFTMQGYTCLLSSLRNRQNQSPTFDVLLFE